jgi:alanyl-tRNA synthetase
MTARLYYDDAYLARFTAQIVEASDGGRRVYLDRSAFYPTSGGQLHDRGRIAGAQVLDVVDEEERVAHVLSAPLEPGPVECAIDWARRFDHMQQHSGQHLLSAVAAEMFGFDTVSVHLGEEISTIDVTARSLDPAQMAAIERRVNEAVCENRAITVSYEEAAGAAGLRKASERTGTLRIVTIEGMDRSACGGTHVRRTGEIGPVLLRKLDRVRDTARIEFVCGARAVACARADYDTLNAAARQFCAAAADVPGLIAAQMEKLAAADKDRRKLAAELAVRQGRELYQTAPVNAQGVRVLEIAAAEKPGEMERLRAQSFAQGARCAVLMVGGAPPAVILAASADSGFPAGETLKKWLAELGGRGGGTAQLAQGSLPAAEAGEGLLARWRAHWGS